MNDLRFGTGGCLGRHVHQHGVKHSVGSPRGAKLRQSGRDMPLELPGFMHIRAPDLDMVPIQ